MKISNRLAIHFDKLEDWEIEELIRLCHEELTSRELNK